MPPQEATPFLHKIVHAASTFQSVQTAKLAYEEALDRYRSAEGGERQVRAEGLERSVNLASWSMAGFAFATVVVAVLQWLKMK